MWVFVVFVVGSVFAVVVAVVVDVGCVFVVVDDVVVFVDVVVDVVVRGPSGQPCWGPFRPLPPGAPVW